MDTTIPSAFQTFFYSFAFIFTSPSFANFVTLSTGWVLCIGRHTISQVLRAGSGPARQKHFSSLYRFFSRAVWVTDKLGWVLLQILLPLIPGDIIHALADDTLCRKSGPHIWGAGMHHDPLRSTYARGTKASRHVAFAFGHNWVVLAIWVPFPWNPTRGVAIPILLRLYRSKKRCPENQYRKRAELAVEMINILAGWIPPGRKLIIIGDSEYACKRVLTNLPAWVDFIGPIVMDAALYDMPGKSSRRGRPRRRGARLPSPMKMAQDHSIAWRKTTLSIYGREVKALIKTQVCLWYSVCGVRPVLVVVTRDPKGRIEDRAYFSTDTSLHAESVLCAFARRWSLEVTFRDCKQHLGLEDPQNGWWRRKAGRKAKRKRPGPQPLGRRGEKAVRRTAPIAFFSYALVVVWYFQHGSITEDVRTARLRAPWYRHKAEPSFADMLQAARRELWMARLSSRPSLKPLQKEIAELIPEWLLAA